MISGQNADYRVVLQGGQGEIMEKRSRFIATVRSVASEQEAAAFIEEMKRKYWDARHNCSAFVIGSSGELTRCSDDGEPGGTAGRPMLEVLLAEELRNVAVVVTRYFGGTLLGTGGLIRAYTQAVKAGLSNCITGVIKHGMEICLRADYNDVGKVLYILGQQGVEPSESRYEQDVRLTVQIAAEQLESLRRDLTEATCGRIGWEPGGEITFVDKKGTKS
ncbi:MAG: YigZ family protein [bacterium]|nr:YigZ family protein [bacterium]MCM1374272.1 YigZ family protein [Muribaculum sp.]